MEGSWFIKGHHLAVKSGGNEYHPTAQEIYSAMDGLGINGISEGTEKVSEYSVITQQTIDNYLVVCWIFCIFK